jgi:outer membrane protein assembly factor BamE (lipoprotein component of BamABCDE complex)
VKPIGRSARRIILLLVVAAVAVLAAAAYNPHERSVGDALSYLMFLREDRTTFAPGFTEEKFDRVQLGMSEAEVVEILGEPLEKDGSTKIYWRYSGGPPDANFWFRVITFQNGRVINKEAKYFVD